MDDVRLTPEAADQFDRLPRTIRTRVTNLIARLRDWPTVSGAKPLRAGHTSVAGSEHGPKPGVR